MKCGTPCTLTVVLDTREDTLGSRNQYFVGDQGQHVKKGTSISLGENSVFEGGDCDVKGGTLNSASFLDSNSLKNSGDLR